MRDRALIDTSAWIPYLQGDGPDELLQLVDGLLAGREIIVPKIIIAGLIQGARTEKDMAAIKSSAPNDSIGDPVLKPYSRLRPRE